MYNKKYSQVLGLCLASVLAYSANAEVMTAAKAKKSQTSTKEMKEEKHAQMPEHSRFFDGNNYFMVKGGLSKPVHALTSKGSNGYKYFDKQKPTYTVGAIIGREFCDRLLGLDLEYRFNPNSKAISTDENARLWKLRSHVLMLNAKASLVKNSAVTPYLRAGVGVSFNHSSQYIDYANSLSSQTYPGKSSNQFTWQGGLGFNFKLNEWFSTNLEYMYTDLGKFTTQGQYTNVMTGSATTTTASPIKGRLKQHLVSFGFKFNF